MTITAYTDGSFNSECKPVGPPHQPGQGEAWQRNHLCRRPAVGQSERVERLCVTNRKHSVSECLLDMTAMDDDDEKKPVHDMVDAIEERLYDYNTEATPPSFVKAVR